MLLLVKSEFWVLQSSVLSHRAVPNMLIEPCVDFMQYSHFLASSVATPAPWADMILPNSSFCWPSLLLKSVSRKTEVHMHTLTNANGKQIVTWMHTILAMPCKISIISENSGRKYGSCCQHLSSNSTTFGWVYLGIEGLKP